MHDSESRRERQILNEREVHDRRSAMRAADRAEGWALVRDGSTLSDRVCGAEMVVDVLFRRSVDHHGPDARRRSHPTYSEFVRMLDLDACGFPAEVVPYLRRRHGEYLPGEIRPGDSYWRHSPCHRSSG
jgi:hypothetical protein